MFKFYNPTTSSKKLSSIEIEMMHNSLASLFWTDQTCYDEFTNLWFIHQPERPELKPGFEYIDKDYDDDCWLMENYNNIEFITLGNGTITISNVDDIFDKVMIIDSNNLNCKYHKLPIIRNSI